MADPTPFSNICSVSEHKVSAPFSKRAAAGTLVRLLNALTLAKLITFRIRGKKGKFREADLTTPGMDSFHETNTKVLMLLLPTLYLSPEIVPCAFGNLLVQTFVPFYQYIFLSSSADVRQTASLQD